MCRLFGMHAGVDPVPATFWLIDAPDSLAEQSRRNPDGAGIGSFGVDGKLTVDKQPMAAWQDSEFATAARELVGTTFVAHVRYATTGAHTAKNTHPFVADGRLFAHNGVVEGLAELDTRIAELGVADLVQGETDSERVFALITAETRRHGGDVAAGITAGIGWVAEHLPVFSVNFVLATATELWALRYPANDKLFLLDPSVIVATEKMDDDRRWRAVESGELLHVDPKLTISSRMLFPDAPRNLLTTADLGVG